MGKRGQAGPNSINRDFSELLRTALVTAIVLALKLESIPAELNRGL